MAKYFQNEDDNQKIDLEKKTDKTKSSAPNTLLRDVSSIVRELILEEFGNSFLGINEDILAQKLLEKQNEDKAPQEVVSKHATPDRYKDIELNIDKFNKAADNFRDFFSEVNDHILESGYIISSLEKAILTREHMLLVGAAGNAKSMIPSYTLARIKDEDTGKPSYFSYMMHALTTADDLLGPIRWDLFKKNGTYERDLDRGILGSNYAYIDEVFDCHPDILRSILNALNERIYRQGIQEREGVLETSFQTTNRYVNEIRKSNRSKDYNALDAYFDRMLFVSLVPEYFLNNKSYYRMADENALLRRNNKIHALQETLTCGDIDTLQRAVEFVDIPREMIEFYTMFMLEFDRTLNNELSENNTQFIRTKQFSKRTFNKNLKAIQAQVIFDKIYKNRDRQMKVTIDDMSKLYETLILNAPSPEKIDSLLKNNLYGSQREKLQLETARKERQLFDRVFAEVKEKYPKAIADESTKINISTLEKENSKLHNKLPISTIKTHFANIIQGISDAEYGKNIYTLRQIKQEATGKLAHYINEFAKHSSNAETSLSNRIKLCEDLNELMALLDKTGVQTTKNPAETFFSTTVDILNIEVNDAFNDSAKKKNVRKEFTKQIEEFASYYSTLEAIGQQFGAASSFSILNGRQILSESAYQFIQDAIETVKSNSKKGPEELVQFIMDHIKYISQPAQHAFLLREIDRLYSEYFSSEEVLRSLSKQQIETNLLNKKLFENTPNVSIKLPRTFKTIQTTLENVILNEITSKNIQADLVFTPGNNTRNLLDYSTFDQNDAKYRESINIDSYLAFEENIQAHFTKDELHGRYFPGLTKYQDGGHELLSLEKKVLFLNEWITAIADQTKTLLEKANSFNDINSCTTHLQSTGFPQLVQQKELFKLKQLLNITGEKLTQSYKKKHQSVTETLQRVETKYNQILKDIKTSTTMILSKDFSPEE